MQERSIQFHCGCGQKLRAKISRVGQNARCPKCEALVAVPFPETVAPKPTYSSQPPPQKSRSQKDLGDSPAPPKKITLTTAAVIFCGLFFGCCLLSTLTDPVDRASRSRPSSTNYETASRSQSTPASRQHSPTVTEPEFSEIGANSAIEIIEGYELVRNAAISHKQSRKTIYLALIVEPIVSDEYARELGDNFVRCSISFLEDGASLGKQIGKSQWTYVVQVNDSIGNVLATGAKDLSASKITW